MDDRKAENFLLLGKGRFRLLRRMNVRNREVAGMSFPGRSGCWTKYKRDNLSKCHRMPAIDGGTIILNINKILFDTTCLFG